jgi:hypothetical protein
LHSTVIEPSGAQVSTTRPLPVLDHVKGMLHFLGIEDIRRMADQGFCDVELMDRLWACGWPHRIRIKFSLILTDRAGRRL